MELSHVGAHCAVETCRQRDFLPFCCTACNLKFCLEHRTPAQHACSEEPAAKVSAVECPVCGAVVAAKGREGIDEAVARHMDGGCKESAAVKAPRCAVGGCRNKDVLRLRCEACRAVTCVSHRAPDQHSCPSVAPVATAAPRGGGGEAAAPSTASRVGARVRALMSSLHSKRKVPASGMVMRQAAAGDAKVPPERRWYAEVQYGLRGKNGWVFLNSSWSVGKAVDALAAMGGMDNRNDVKEAPKLCLFDLQTGQPLSSLTLLRDLPSGTMVLLLDTEASVFE